MDLLILALTISVIVAIMYGAIPQPTKIVLLIVDILLLVLYFMGFGPHLVHRG